MKYIVDKADRPAYLQLYKQLRADIIAGVYPYGGKLPSKRLLADESGVSTITVEHAYALLCDEGYAESRQRSGYYVSFRHTDGFAVTKENARDPAAKGISDKNAAEKNVEHIASLPYSSVATRSPYPTFSEARFAKTVRRVLTEYPQRILEKSPSTGIAAFREAIRAYLARNRGISVDTEQIVVGAGAEYLYGGIVRLLGRGKRYAIESPSYDKLERLYRAENVALEFLPLSGDGIDSKALETTHADVLHTTPYRSFPSGITASASKRHEYIRWADEGERYIIESDYGSEFSVASKPTETLFALSDKGNVIYLNTFSRTISPSLRVGYMVLPPKLAERFHDRFDFYSCSVPTVEQLVLTELLQSGDFERHINRVRRALRRKLSSFE